MEKETITKDILKPFKQHGVVFRGSNASQAYGDCPFTGKVNKFYVNKSNLCWDSKVAGLSGNLQGFLEAISEQNVKDMNAKSLTRLAENRGLPPEAFQGYEIGFSGNGYTFPVRNEKKMLMDLRMYQIDKQILSTSGCAVWLFNVKALIESPVEYPVFLCEGEWDTIAMAWLLKKLEIKAVAVGVPGANTFKREWVSYFQNRQVLVCYDNDEAGEQGEVIVDNRLRGTIKGITFLHWPISLPSGYDLRDLIKLEAIQNKKPKKTLRLIYEMQKKFTRKSLNAGEGITEEITEGKDSVIIRRTTFEDVEKVFKKWLYLDNTDAIKTACAVILSTRMKGDPLWMMLVAPPGGSKTEIISSFNMCPNVYLTSSLTPHAMVSGANDRDGSDPSLLPKLNNKCLNIKDFTVILGKKEADREEIFSIFRDAYDGATSKDFGNGIKRNYKCHFSILAGVTPIIYNLGMQHAGLGERFLKFYIGDSIRHPSELEMMRKAIKNVSHEFTMREELAIVMRDFMNYKLSQLERSDFKYPEIPETLETRLINAVVYTANMRGTVTRDIRNNDIVMSKPFREVGTRLGKNIAKFLINLAFVMGKKEVGEEEYLLIKKILLDTIDQRAEEIVRKLYLATLHPDDTVPTREIARLTRYNSSTIGRIMNDLNLLKIVERTGKNNKFNWRVSHTISDLIKNSGFYTTEIEKNRQRRDLEIKEIRATTKVKIKLKKKE